METRQSFALHFKLKTILLFEIQNVTIPQNSIKDGIFTIILPIYIHLVVGIKDELLAGKAFLVQRHY